MKIKSDIKNATILSVKFPGSKNPSVETKVNIHFGKQGKKASIIWKKQKPCVLELRNIKNTTFAEYFHIKCSWNVLNIEVKENLRKYSDSLVKVAFRQCKNCTVCKKHFKS